MSEWRARRTEHSSGWRFTLAAAVPIAYLAGLLALVLALAASLVGAVTLTWSRWYARGGGS